MGERLGVDPLVLLEQPNRQRVLQAIRNQPGSSSVVLGRLLHFSPSVIMWHGDKLRRAGLVVIVDEKSGRTYWPAPPSTQ